MGEDAQIASVTGARSVVILGGTGDVGRRLIPMLATVGPWEIWAVSRRDHLTGPELSNARTLNLDLAGPEAARVLPRGAIFVNLTEATPPGLVAEILSKGDTVLDTSATPEYVDALVRVAVGKAGLLIPGVGTAPGLCTLLGADLARDRRVRALDVGLELGMGRHYGPAASEWFFRTLGASYRDPGSGRTVKPGMNLRRFVFAPTEAPRTALDIGFPDIAIFPAGREGQVRYYLAVDPPIVTRLVAVALWLGLGPWIARHARLLAKQSQRLPKIGHSGTRIVVAAFDHNNKQIESHLFEGGDQADLTAAMVLLTIDSVCSGGDEQGGAQSIMNYLDLEQALRGLQRRFPDGTITMNGKQDLH